MIEFRFPLAFLLFILAPLMLEHPLRERFFLLLGRKRRDQSSRLLRFASAGSLGSLPRSARLRIRPYLLSLLRIVAFLLFVLALARPQTGTRFTEIETSGRDIMLTLDISGSMQALDFTLNGEHVDRLVALKHVVEDFIDKRVGDRMGLVIFGTHAYTQCPLTRDRGVLKQFVKSLEIGMAGETTAIGSALAISLKRIKDIPAQSKVILLVTDGRNNTGELNPAQAARIAKERGIKVYAVGIGGNKPVPFPAVDWFGRRTIGYQNLELDEKTLKDIAEITGGRYYNAQNTEELKMVYDEIDKLEERVEKAFEFVDYQEHFLPFLAAGFVLFLVCELLAASVFLAIP